MLMYFEKNSYAETTHSTHGMLMTLFYFSRVLELFNLVDNAVTDDVIHFLDIDVPPITKILTFIAKICLQVSA